MLAATEVLMLGGCSSTGSGGGTGGTTGQGGSVATGQGGTTGGTTGQGGSVATGQGGTTGQTTGQGGSVATGSGGTTGQGRNRGGTTGQGGGRAGTTGAGGQAGSSSATGGVGGGTAAGPAPTQLPTATGCPVFPTGTSSTTASGTIMVARSDQPVPVDIYMSPNAKSKPAPGGPIVLYYHASYEPQMSKEVQQGFTAANIQKVMDAGGVVAAFNHVSCSGCQTTDDNWWYVQDDPVQDFVVACAIQQANIDTRHIHALGWSAGALHSMHIGFARANYMASIVSYSGGNPSQAQSQNPTNHFSSILTYGDQGTDVVIIDFNQNSHTYFTTYQPMGYYTMMCHHAGGHEIDPMVAPVSLDFFMAHPYKVSPEPYANGIPTGFPSYCGNTPT
jgi:hypothetical protein